MAKTNSKMTASTAMPLPEGYVGTAEIARALGVARITVEVWGKKGLPFMRQFVTPGGRKLYCMDRETLATKARETRNGPQPIPVA